MLCIVLALYSKPSGFHWWLIMYMVLRGCFTQWWPPGKITGQRWGGAFFLLLPNLLLSFYIQVPRDSSHCSLKVPALPFSSHSSLKTQVQPGPTPYPISISFSYLQSFFHFFPSCDHRQNRSRWSILFSLSFLLLG